MQNLPTSIYLSEKLMTIADYSKKIVFLFFVAILLFSCKAKPSIDTQNNNDSIALDSLKVDSVIAKNNFNLPKDAHAKIPIDERITFFEKTLIHPNFEHLKIQSKLKIEVGNSIPTLDATIYIENQQKVWINLALFLNVARGIANTDGIKAYEKYNGTYIDSDFDYLNKMLNVDFINLPTLQKILMGRTFIPIKGSQFLLTKNWEGYFLTSKENQVFGNSTLEEPAREYKISLYYSQLFDLEKVLLKDATSGDELEILYDQWEDFSNYRMPKYVKIIIKGSKNGQILIENTKFENLKMQTPYSVPKNYTKIEIQ